MCFAVEGNRNNELVARELCIVKKNYWVLCWFLDERNNAYLLLMRMSWQRGKDCGDTGDLEETVAGRLQFRQIHELPV